MGDVFKNYEGKPGHKAQTRHVMGLVGDVTGKSVLDLACGYGFYGRKLKKRGADRVGEVDISEKIIAFARAESQEADDDIEFQCKMPAKLGLSGNLTLLRQFSFLIMRKLSRNCRPCLRLPRGI